MRYSEKWPEYAAQWDKMIINAAQAADFKRIAYYAIMNSGKYHLIQAATGVPWPMIAAIHCRESDAQDHDGNPLFTSYLGNGQPLNKKTTIVPMGRGPFDSFFDGAIDALHVDLLDQVKDWRLEKMLYYLEIFNGIGYHMRHMPSSYIWGGTNIQVRGKFVKDHRWNAQSFDHQPGCAPILFMIAQMDDSVKYARES